MTEEKTRASKRVTCILLIISLVICLVSVSVANTLQTAGGQVTVEQVIIGTDVGHISAEIFKPVTATVDHPAPCVIASHGMFNSKEMQDPACNELARRGFVVIAYDMYGHGHSSNSDNPRFVKNSAGQYYNVDKATFVDSPKDATAFETHGMIEMVEYAWNNLGYVDHNKIGVTGHSMGGVSSTWTMKYYHYQQTVGDGVKKINAAFLQSCNEATLPGEMDGINVGYVVGLNDEMFNMGMGMNPALKQAGITTVPQLDQFQADAFVKTYAGYNQPYRMGTNVYDKDGMLRVYYTIVGDHPWVHISTDATGDLIKFFTTAFHVESILPATDQISFTKEVFNGIGLIGFFMFILQFIILMLGIPFFQSLKIGSGKGTGSLEASMLDRPKTGKDIAVYAAGLVLFGILPGLLFYPFMGLNAIPKSQIFPQTMNNNEGMWVLLMGLIMIGIVAVIFAVFHRGKGYTARNLGLMIRDEGETKKQGFSKVMKSIFLAAITVTVGYFIVFLLYNIFNADFRFFELAVKTFDMDRILIMIPYLIFFLVWSFGLNVAVNTNFRRGMSEKTVLTITTAANVLGLTIPLFMYFVPFAANGTPNSPEFINPILMFPIPVLVAVATVYSRRIYKRTGNVYLGTILTAILICLITVVNTHIAYPYWFI